ncbi:serine/threonine protein kinase [Micrococcales bacterium KH10]|nr:serine/threonine protein kinase [Micrococcales bacterium KH10]
MTVPVPGPGLIFGDRYRLVRQIAVGGMGEVWVAQDTSLSRDVAIKVLKAEFAGNTDFLARLRTEARNAASLSNSGIAQLYDYGEKDGIGYLVMELIIGEPMSDLLERSPVLPLDRTLDILAQAARALHSAHVAGVVHRDVKPGNILLERSGEVKITDFGVSLAADQAPMTATGMVMGTAQYLSPEQAVGKPATPSSDIYALGVIAYEALVGHRPFTGKTAVDIAVAHVNEPVPALSSSVPPDVAALVTRMLAKDPSDRPRSGAQLAVMLDEIGARYRKNPWLGSVGAPSGPQRAVNPPAHNTPVRNTPVRNAPVQNPAGNTPVRNTPVQNPTPAQPVGNANARPASTPPAAAGPRPPTGPRPPAAPRSGTRPSSNGHSGAATGQASRGQSTATNRGGNTAPAPQRGRRSSTTTGQRVGRWSWQAVVLAILVLAVLVAWLIGAFSNNADAATMSASGLVMARFRVHSAIAASHREQCNPAVRTESPSLTAAGDILACCPDEL